MLVEEYHLRWQDDEIREANMPERLFEKMQDGVIPRFRTEDAADYIYNSLFGHDVNPLAKVRTAIQGQRLIAAAYVLQRHPLALWVYLPYQHYVFFRSK